MDTFASHLTTHASRLTARLSENLAERSKDLGLPLSLDALSNPAAAANGLVSGLGKGMWDDPKLLTPEGERETLRLLNARNDREREDGLRRVILMMCKNRPVLSFFPAVTNCLHSPTFSTASAGGSPTSALVTRQLVSIYILRHARRSPDLALLSVNAYQKDLTDPNPAIRALALRALAGMGLDTVAPLVIMSVNKSCRDGNWWVRKAACEAIVAVYALDPSAHRATLVDGPLQTLLADRSPLVLGSALAAWNAICPGRYDLLHRHYRRYCRALADVDEWGQLVVLRVLIRYARSHFLDPNAPSASDTTHTAVDPDLDLLLRSAAVLFQSRNPAVVLTAAYTYCYLAPAGRLSAITLPLLSLVRAPSSPELLLATLSDISLIASKRSDLFVPYLHHFYVFTADPSGVRRIKLSILVSLAGGGGRTAAEAVLEELRHYVKDQDIEFVKGVIRAAGEVALGSSDVTSKAMKLLVRLTHSSTPAVVSQAIIAIRSLLRHPSQASSLTSIVSSLVRILIHGKVASPDARATIYWLLGQHSTPGSPLLDSVAPDALRLALSAFPTEPGASKLQILACLAKALVSSHLSPLEPHGRFYALAFQHAASMARYDRDFEVRDRARFLRGLVTLVGGIGVAGGVQMTADAFARGEDLGSDLLPGPSSAVGWDKHASLRAEEVRQILFDRKTGPSRTGAAGKAKQGKLGSLSRLSGAAGFEAQPEDAVPPWTTLVLDARVRDEPETSSAASVSPFPAAANARALPSGASALRGFGSDSFGGAGGSRSGSRSGRRHEPVVLVPTDATSVGYAGGSARASRRPKPEVQKLDDFLGDSDSGEDGSEEGYSSEEVSSDGEEDEEGGDDSSEGERRMRKRAGDRMATAPFG